MRRVLGLRPLLFKSSNASVLRLKESIHIVDCYYGDREFKFLNLSTSFKKNIDWNYSHYGKLWTYNLTYFDYLSQRDMRDDNLALIESFIDNVDNIKDGLEPFPISLRGVNWIKYLTYNDIREQRIDDSLYAQYYTLLDNLEYHLLGNHLLENGFSLLFGAYYFGDDVLYKKAEEILIEQLDEQILDDGGHFELSPMYHQIMLFRVLDCINLVKNNSWKNRGLLEFLRTKAELMLGWLKNISYNNGDVPLLNDSANGIAPTTKQLMKYANNLELKIQYRKLSDSGYRKFSNDRYECIIDIGNIGAEYIPGHAHADSFNFELRLDGQPFIVDTGLSTYETCQRRTIERSTLSHNTVEVNSKNQSEVWGGFRVANRAKVIDIKEEKNRIEATHDGYKKDKIYHTRVWEFEEDGMMVLDTLSREPDSAVVRLHFHPTLSKEYILNHIKIYGGEEWKFGEYKFSPEFNREISAFMIEIKMRKPVKIKFF